MDTKLLRQKILDLAIRGKLVPQDPNDEPASVLLEKIRAEKKRLIKEKKIKPTKGKSDKSHYKKEVPFEVPESWEWCRLGLLCEYGKSEKANPTQINDNAWVLDLEDIEKDSGKLLKRVRKIEKDSKSTRNVFKKGDVLYSKLRTYLNKVLIADQKGYCTTEILPLDFNGFVVPEYARYVLMSNYFLDYTAECCYGVKMPRLGTYDGENAPFPLPPLNEQKRISSKINSLFVLIDRINENQLSLEQFVNQTKSKVLELAIKGKLVPQNPEDEPASTLLERLGIKKASSDTSHYPFEVPKNWLWCNFSDLYILISGRDLDKDEFNDVGFGIPYLIGASSLINNQFEVNRWTTTPKVLSEKDDLLITCKGTVGELIINDIGKVHIARQFMAIRSIVKIKTKFTKYFFEYSIETIKERAKGVIPGISRKDILEIFIPLPPLAEQKRIVSQIEKIFAQLEIIEDSLKA